jgi:hypothetical protein
MNEQNFAERVNYSGNAEQTNQDMDRPVVNSDSYDEEAPVLATLLYETPMGGTIAPVDPLNDETIVQEAPMGQTIVYDKDSMGETLIQETPSVSKTDSATTLFTREEVEQFGTHWNEIQGSFVDEPRLAVEQADALVREVIEKIAQLFASEHDSLENQWKQGNDVSTEDLRKTLQHYHAFFNRLVVQLPDQI